MNARLVSVLIFTLIGSSALAQDQISSERLFTEKDLTSKQISGILPNQLKPEISDFSPTENSTFNLADTVPTASSGGKILPGGFIEKMDNYLITQLAFVDDTERFSVDQGTQDYQIYPNGSSALKIHFNYRFLSVGFSLIPKFISGNDDNDLKGKTKGFGFNTGFNFTHWFQTVGYGQIRGFYLDNTKDFDNSWQEGDPYVQFPDLLYRSFHGTTGYSFNPNFSTKALMTGTERQLKSAGSFIPTLRYRYYLVDNREKLNATNSTQKSNNFEILANAGYYYTYVINKQFYLSAGGSAGYGYLYSKITTRRINDEAVNKQNNGVFRYDLQAAAGYNSERFYAGLIFTTENRRYKQSNTSVINSDWRVFSQITLGYRFNAPNTLRENLNKISPQ